MVYWLYSSLPWLPDWMLLSFYWHLTVHTAGWFPVCWLRYGNGEIISWHILPNGQKAMLSMKWMSGWKVFQHWSLLWLPLLCFLFWHGVTDVLIAIPFVLLAPYWDSYHDTPSSSLWSILPNVIAADCAHVIVKHPVLMPKPMKLIIAVVSLVWIAWKNVSKELLNIPDVFKRKKGVIRKRLK